jgi:hypothetical protein
VREKERGSVCASVWERERGGNMCVLCECVGVCECLGVCECVGVCECMCVRERGSVCASVWVRERERERKRVCVLNRMKLNVIAKP